MKYLLSTLAMTLALTGAASADGNIEKGKKAFGKCRSCHTIVSPEGEVIQKGGRTGPNLYGVVGRTAGQADFRYSKALRKVSEDGLVWDEAAIAAFVTDPRGYLKAQNTDGKTRMTFRLKKGGEDVAAYLASLNPAPVVEAEVVAEPDVEAAE